MATREQIIEVATGLFARAGYRAVGVAEIVMAAAVSRAAFYACFRSKDDLILAVLRRRDEAVRDMVLRAIERDQRSGGAKLLAIFDFLEEWSGRSDFTGCMFLNAAAEFHPRDDPIHRMAAEHKRLMLEGIARLCAAAGADDPGALAAQLYLLFDGVIVQAQACGPGVGRMRAARAAARALIEAACPPTPC
ncbi:TetR/AcrR family transcriptional regulator [Rubrimonas sp.]|uniref:TetR/AcrR family transcriptional regulator n=1 Tax=Rubrimonas sp. TaxID=2036015 RepID=UPI002FDDCDF2